MNQLSASILIMVFLCACSFRQPIVRSTEKLPNSDTSFCQTDTSDIFGKNIYKHLSPNQFLDHLMKYKKFKFITYGTAPLDWIKEKDIEILVKRIYDTTSIPSIVNPLSSYLPNKYSCIGREAQNMIEAYIDKKGYLDFLYSCGGVDSAKAKRLNNWYNLKY